jgi:3-hydroxyisobutyrate dehydrogenase-like beta-hydroxyacid dehydrogenase
MNITILGMGAMGSRMADRLEAADYNVTRWNRSGATQTPRQAVADADIVIAMLRDDEASRTVWLDADIGALAGLGSAAVAIESSTLTVDWVRELGAAMANADRAFLDAPVLGSRPQAEAGQLVHLIGGNTATIKRVQPVLATIGGAQLHAGPVSSGAALKLVANTLFGIQVTAMAELIGRMPSLGLDAAQAIDLLAQTPLLSPAAKGASGLMLADKREAMFPIDLVAKDFGYAIGDNPGRMPVATAALDVFNRAQEAGLGDQNLTAVSSLY